MTRISTLTKGAGRFLAFVLLVLLIGGAFAAAEPRFLSQANFAGITRHMAANGLAALGLTFVVIVRRFDLSLAGVASFSAMSMGAVIAAGFPLWIAVLAGLMVGGGIGLVNGIAVSRFGLPDIVTTIATGSIVSGMAFLYTGGRSIFQNFFTSGIIRLNDARFLGFGASLWFLLAAYAVAWFVMHRTRSGTAFYAAGENPVSAYYSGVNVGRYTTLAFMICGLCAVLAVTLILAESGNAETNKGANLMMPAYAGVFLGAALMGGTSVLASLAGIFLITMLLDGFSLLGVPYYYSDGVVSLILLMGVLLFSDAVRDGWRGWRMMLARPARGEGQ